MKYRIRVRTWVLYEATVEIEAPDDRRAREFALVKGHSHRDQILGTITKNQTTILEKGFTYGDSL